MNEAKTPYYITESRWKRIINLTHALGDDPAYLIGRLLDYALIEFEKSNGLREDKLGSEITFIDENHPKAFRNKLNVQVIADSSLKLGELRIETNHMGTGKSDLGRRFQDMAAKAGTELLMVQDAMLKRAFDSLGVLDVVTHIMKSGNPRLTAAAARKWQVDLKTEDYGDPKGEFGKFVIVTIRGKVFETQHVVFNLR